MTTTSAPIAAFAPVAPEVQERLDRISQLRAESERLWAKFDACVASIADIEIEIDDTTPAICETVVETIESGSSAAAGDTLLTVGDKIEDLTHEFNSRSTDWQLGPESDSLIEQLLSLEERESSLEVERFVQALAPAHFYSTTNTTTAA